MPEVLFAALAFITWVSLGLFAVVFFLARHGRRSAYWYVIGAALGPILLPISAELASSRGRVLWRHQVRDEHAGKDEESVRTPALSTVVVAIDGSPESDHAAQEAAAQFASKTTRVVLVMVLDPDDSGDQRQANSRALLQERAVWFDTFVSVMCEIDHGDPVSVILSRAEAIDADVLVLGRRGRGFSRRVLGSVADRVVRRFPHSVVLGPSAAPMIGAGQRDEPVEPVERD